MRCHVGIRSSFGDRLGQHAFGMLHTFEIFDDTRSDLPLFYRIPKETFEISWIRAVWHDDRDDVWGSPR